MVEELVKGTVCGTVVGILEDIKIGEGLAVEDEGGGLADRVVTMKITKREEIGIEFELRSSNERIVSAVCISMVWV